MADTGKSVLVRLRDPASLARAQGSLAALAQSLAPATIESKVYDTFRDTLAQSLKDKGIDADVSVVQAAGFRPADGSHIATDIGFAIGGAGVLGVMWYLFSSKGHKRK